MLLNIFFVLLMLLKNGFVYVFFYIYLLLSKFFWVFLFGVGSSNVECLGL